MKIGSKTILSAFLLTCAAETVTGEVSIVIKQSPSDVITAQSAVEACRETWDRMVDGDAELEEYAHSRFGSKRSYLKKCATELIEADGKKLQYPVKEVYCELQAYQKTIEAFYEKFEGNFIDWKKFRTLTVMYSASSECMNKPIP